MSNGKYIDVFGLKIIARIWLKKNVTLITDNDGCKEISDYLMRIAILHLAPLFSEFLISR